MKTQQRTIRGDAAAGEIDLRAHTRVAAFYKFVAIDNPATLQTELREFCTKNAVKGTILIAAEGINATVSGSEDAIAALIGMLHGDGRFADLAVKFSEIGEHPFQRLKIKIKCEIVAFDASTTRPSVQTGHAVEPEDWNALICEPGVLIIDTRNDYEVSVGTFEGASNPGMRSFREFPGYVARVLAGDRQRKIAMFCTGGIRCEKASSYLLSEGFTNVYQLNGGILRYLERIPPDDSLWRGECFVFDERVALAHGVRRGGHGLCSRCGHPVRLAGQSGEPLCAGCSSAGDQPGSMA